MEHDVISENEIKSFLGRLIKAQKDGRPWGFLKKGQDATRNLSTLNQNAINTVGLLGGRAVYHTDRLLEQGRSDQEKNFALALVGNTKELMEKEKVEDRLAICRVVSGEGVDCCLWWTLSPYIFAELKPKVGERKAVELLLEWSQTGKPLSEIRDSIQVNLRGLQMYNQAGHHCTFTLSRDAKGASHLFANQEAQRLVREVFV